MYCDIYIYNIFSFASPKVKIYKVYIHGVINLGSEILVFSDLRYTTLRDAALSKYTHAALEVYWLKFSLFLFQG